MNDPKDDPEKYSKEQVPYALDKPRIIQCTHLSQVSKDF